MKLKALFTSHNLIGDALCVSAALRVWHQEHPEFEIDLLTDNNSAAELYKGMGVPLRVIFEPTEHEVHDGKEVSYKINYAFYHTFDVNRAFKICDEKKCHLAQGYADDLGVKLGNSAADLGPFYMPPEPSLDDFDRWLYRVPRDSIVIAPFSRSCSSHTGGQPNKCLPWVKWKPILRFLRSLEKPIRVTGSMDERADELDFSEDEYIMGMPLPVLAWAMRREERIHLFVSVDNGLSHLAGSQRIWQILFYPMCLGLHYAVPWSNPFVVPIHIDPAFAEPAQLTWSVKQSYQLLQSFGVSHYDELS
jgi:ADP-heptose:LPS heptosyltransferase